MNKFNLRESLRLYAVTDRAWLNGGSLASAVEQAISGGATFVQLREKELTYGAFLEQTQAVKAVTDRYRVPYVVNDNIQVALACGADGVHIGQSDETAALARAQLGPNKILGISVQTVAQALAAEKAGADYLGVGAVFPTATKRDADYVPYALLKEICESVDIPVVAIGGIGARNVPELCGSGIAGVAVISALFAAPDIRAAAEELYELTGRLKRA